MNRRRVIETLLEKRDQILEEVAVERARPYPDRTCYTFERGYALGRLLEVESALACMDCLIGHQGPLVEMEEA